MQIIRNAAAHDAYSKIVFTCFDIVVLPVWVEFTCEIYFESVICINATSNNAIFIS